MSNAPEFVAFRRGLACVKETMSNVLLLSYFSIMLMVLARSIGSSSHTAIRRLPMATDTFSLFLLFLSLYSK